MPIRLVDKIDLRLQGLIYHLQATPISALSGKWPWSASKNPMDNGKQQRAKKFSASTAALTERMAELERCRDGLKMEQLLIDDEEKQMKQFIAAKKAELAEEIANIEAQLGELQAEYAQLQRMENEP